MRFKLAIAVKSCNFPDITHQSPGKDSDAKQWLGLLLSTHRPKNQLLHIMAWAKKCLDIHVEYKNWTRHAAYYTARLYETSWENQDFMVLSFCWTYGTQSKPRNGVHWVDSYELAWILVPSRWLPPYWETKFTVHSMVFLVNNASFRRATKGKERTRWDRANQVFFKHQQKGKYAIIHQFKSSCRLNWTYTSFMAVPQNIGNTLPPTGRTQQKQKHSRNPQISSQSSHCQRFPIVRGG